MIYSCGHIYRRLGNCLGYKIRVSDLTSFVNVIDVHVYFWSQPLVFEVLKKFSKKFAQVQIYPESFF